MASSHDRHVRAALDGYLLDGARRAERGGAMRPQTWSTTVSCSLTSAEERLADVVAWPAFLTHVVDVRHLGDERYDFGLDDGTRATVVVRRDRHRHVLHWYNHRGPAFAGSVSLAPGVRGRTTVTLTVSRPPATFRAAFAAIGELEALDEADAQALRAHLERHHVPPA
jgi:hypothetical protein